MPSPMRGRTLSPTAARVVDVKLEPYNVAHAGKAGKTQKIHLDDAEKGIEIGGFAIERIPMVMQE